MNQETQFGFSEGFLATAGIVVAVVALFIAVMWILLPILIMQMRNRLDTIIAELRKLNAAPKAAPPNIVRRTHQVEQPPAQPESHVGPSKLKFPQSL